MSNETFNSDKKLKRKLYELFKDLENNDQVGGSKKYTSSDVDKILRNSLQYVLYLYSKSEAEKAALLSELDNKTKELRKTIPVAIATPAVGALASAIGGVAAPGPIVPGPVVPGPVVPGPVVPGPVVPGPAIVVTPPGGVVSSTATAFYMGPKTFYLNIVKNNNVFIMNLIKILRSVLLSMCWTELSDSEVEGAKTIGFSFSNQKTIIIKSIYNYRIYEFNYKVLTNKSKFYDLIDKKYVPDYYNLNNDPTAIFAKITELNAITGKQYLLKDPMGSMGINIVDIKTIKKIEDLNKILANFKDIQKSGVNISELVNSIVIKKDKIVIDNVEIRKADTVGRRSVIRFLFMLNLTRSNIHLYRYDNFYSYLTLEEKNDILDPINYITNIVYRSKNDIDTQYNASNIYKDKKSQDYALIQKIISGQIDISNIGKHYVASKDEIKSSIGNEKFLKLDSSINEFCSSLLDKLKKIISCKNDFIFNDDFEGCFNVFAIDCIYTQSDELKILEINTSPGTLDLTNNEEFKHFKFSGTRLVIDAIHSAIKLQTECIPNDFKLVKSEARYVPSFYAFVGKQRFKNYPEITDNLIKRGYNINIWKPPYNKKSSRINYGDLAMPKKAGSSEEGDEAMSEEFEMEGGATGKTILKEDFEEDIDNTKEVISTLDSHKYYDTTNKIIEIATILGDKRSYYDTIATKIKNKEIPESDIIAPYIGFKLKADPAKNNEYVLLDEEGTNTKLDQIKTWIDQQTKGRTNIRFIIKPDKGSQSSGIKIIEGNLTKFNEWVTTNYDEKKYINWTMSLFIEGDTTSGNKLTTFHLANEAKGATKNVAISGLKLNDQRKYHIRGYFLISKTTSDTDITIYFIDRPIIYLAGMAYTTTPSQDESKFVNLTNLARTTEYLAKKNIENVNIDLFTEGYTKDAFVGTGPTKIDQAKYDKIMQQVLEKGMISIMAIKDNLSCINKSSPDYKGCYHLIAIDYHVEKNTNNVYILEVNQGPGMKALRINYNLGEIYDNILGLTIDKINGIAFAPAPWMRQVYPSISRK